jgi:hypothetical protein
MTDYLKIVGVKGEQLPHATDGILTLFKTKEVTSILVGAAAGGLVYGLLQKVQPKGDKRLHYTIAVLVAVVVAVFVYSRQRASTPFAGTWSLQPSESQYEVGGVPRGATCTMSEEAGGLRIVEDVRPAKGKEQHVSYVLDTDGKERTVDGSNGAEGEHDHFCGS